MNELAGNPPAVCGTFRSSATGSSTASASTAVPILRTLGCWCPSPREQQSWLLLQGVADDALE
eukprot:2912165-Prymnesium_polylepis.1